MSSKTALMDKLRPNDSVHWFMNELRSRVVAESGRPTDTFHLGKHILQSLKDAPEFVLQIDGSTGESETFASVLQRSVKCAISLRNLGLKKNDIMVLMAPNHLDLAIPFYAALYLGITISSIDRTLTSEELQRLFKVIRPKVIFCHGEKVSDVQIARKAVDTDCNIVTFDSKPNVCSLNQLLKDSESDEKAENFRPTDFSPEDTVAFLVSTSGTTGTSKFAVITHKHFSITGPYLWARYSSFPTPTRMSLLASPLQWLTAILYFVFSPMLRFTRLQCSQPLTQDHAYHVINTYKPSFTVISPPLLVVLIKPNTSKQCDFTCFDMIIVGGSAVSKELIKKLRDLTPNTDIVDGYGISEIGSIGFNSFFSPPGSCGKPIGCFQYRLVNNQSNEDVYESNTPGELWIKGPWKLQGYYNNPDATKEAFTEDGWFKTGDLFYRDENWNFYFVERMKLLLKYNNHQISPVEVENVIRQHPNVVDVAVSSISDPDCGDLPVACVVLNEEGVISAEEIKDLVKKSLTETKQLRGGVIFLKEIPVTPTVKVDRRKLKELVLHTRRH